MAVGHVELVFPIRGVDRSSAYQQQRPYTAYDALNVRSESAEEQRERGGSRPGLVKAYEETLGSAQPIRMLADLTYLRSDVGGGSAYADEFRSRSQLGQNWTVPLTSGYSLALTAQDDEDTQDDSPAVLKGGGILDLIDHETSQPYTVRMLLLPYNGFHRTGTRRLWAAMDETTPDERDRCVELKMVRGGSVDDKVHLSFIDGGTVLSTFSAQYATDVLGKPVWLSLRFDGTTVNAYIDGVDYFGAKTCPWNPATHRRYGFGLESSGRFVAIDRFELRYPSAKTDIGTGTQVVAAANGDLYTESDDGRMTVVTTSATLNTDRHLMAVDRGGKLYIADHGDDLYLASGQTGVIAAVSGSVQRLGDPGADFVSVSPAISPKDHIVEIFNASADANNGTYQISEVLTSAIVLDIGSLTAGSCQFRIGRGPKVYDPATDTLELLTPTAGTVPYGCDKIELYRDRLLFSRRQEWFMSRFGTPTDFNYGAEAEDNTRAVAGVSSEAGVLPGEVTAIGSYISDYLMIWTASETFVMRGDPAYNGRIDQVSDVVGCVGRRAWCPMPDGSVIWLSHDGLYRLPPSAAGEPQSLSRERLPNELRNVNPDNEFVQLIYSPPFRGVHIFKTRADGSAGDHWFFDPDGGAFWPERYATDVEPWSVLSLPPDRGRPGAVLLGGRDGVIRRHHELADNDDGNNFESFVDIGPVKLGGRGRAGVLRTLTGVLSDDSAPVLAEVRVGETANQAANNPVRASATWDRDLAPTMPVRAFGAAAIIRVSGKLGNRWAMESVLAEIEVAGTRRIG